jgi:hypothetical protein
MRTIQQHEQGSAAMILRLKRLANGLCRPETGLPEAEDVLGVAALFLVLFAALALPAAV